MADEQSVVAAGDVTEEIRNSAEEQVEETSPQATENEGEPKPHKKGGWQRKIERLELERETLLGLLKQQVTPTEPAKPAVTVDDDPEPDPEKFDTTLDYLKAARAWDKRQAVKEAEDRVLKKLEEREQQASQRTEQQKANESWEQKKAAAREKYEDFDDALEADVKITPAIGKVLLKSPDGADLAYYLGTHPEETQAIARMDELDTAIALGKISAKLAKDEPQAETEDESSTPPPKKAPPKPPSSIRKTGAVSGKPFNPVDPSTWKDHADYAAKMAKYEKEHGWGR